MKKNTGFSLVEVLTSVAVVGVLSVIAVPAYYIHIAKAQSSESIKMMDEEKSNIVKNLTQKSLCTPNGSNYEIVGKYGSLSVSGTVKINSLTQQNTLLKTGCTLTYTFANSGVSKRLQGKKVSSELFNNGTLSKSPTTNIDSQYLPKSFTTLNEDTYVAAPPITNEEAYVVKDTDGITPDASITGGDTGLEAPYQAFETPILTVVSWSEDFQNGNLNRGAKTVDLPHDTELTLLDGTLVSFKSVYFGKAWAANPCPRCAVSMRLQATTPENQEKIDAYTRVVFTATNAKGTVLVLERNNGTVTTKSGDFSNYTLTGTKVKVELFK